MLGERWSLALFALRFIAHIHLGWRIQYGIILLPLQTNLVGLKPDASSITFLWQWEIQCSTFNNSMGPHNPKINNKKTPKLTYILVCNYVCLTLIYQHSTLFWIFIIVITKHMNYGVNVIAMWMKKQSLIYCYVVILIPISFTWIKRQLVRDLIAHICINVVRPSLNKSAIRQ